MIKLKLLLISLMLVGCASKPIPPQIVYQTVEVEIPIYQIPKFSIPDKPKLPIYLLNDSHKDDHNAIGRAYVSTVKILEAHTEQLRNLLEGIKKGED